jgi:intracellular sulfur oxidation DsrE/DsrF family protein
MKLSMPISTPLPAILSVALLTISSVANSKEPAPIINDFGYFYSVPAHDPISETTQFKIAFDIDKGANAGEQSNQINSLARFINMHVAHGVKLENINLALVVHGSATVDLLDNSAYSSRFNVDNKNKALIEQLLANNTQVFLCGQSAMHNKIAIEQLIPGVKMSLSAMTAHATLQQQGYTLNPF